jgi:hypothetical protein
VHQEYERYHLQAEADGDQPGSVLVSGDQQQQCRCGSARTRARDALQRYERGLLQTRLEGYQGLALRVRRVVHRPGVPRTTLRWMLRKAGLGGVFNVIDRKYGGCVVRDMILMLSDEIHRSALAS